jgi:hypothetical protein
MYYFDPNDASLLYGTVQSRPGFRQGFFGDTTCFFGRWKVLDYIGFCPDCDCGGNGGITESLIEGSTNSIFVHVNPGYSP